MKKLFLSGIVLAAVALSCMGCGRILLPYHENFLCNRGAGTGYCGSLRQVYTATVQNDKSSETAEQSEKAVHILEGGKCACQVK